MQTVWIALLSLVISCGAASISAYQAFINRGQLEISKDQEVRQLRAYVGPAYAQIAKNSNLNHLYIQIVFHNYGQTPANDFNYVWHSNTEIKSAENIYNTQNSDVDSSLPDTIFPGTDQNWNTDFTIASFQDEFSADRRVVTFFGTSFYMDAFGVKRKGEFCYIVRKDDIISLTKSPAPIVLQGCNGIGRNT